jgi:hypothetical protein
VSRVRASGILISTDNTPHNFTSTATASPVNRRRGILPRPKAAQNAGARRARIYTHSPLCFYTPLMGRRTKRKTRIGGILQEQDEKEEPIYTSVALARLTQHLGIRVPSQPSHCGASASIVIIIRPGMAPQAFYHHDYCTIIGRSARIGVLVHRRPDSGEGKGPAFGPSASCT